MEVRKRENVSLKEQVSKDVAPMKAPRRPRKQGTDARLLVLFAIGATCTLYLLFDSFRSTDQFQVNPNMPKRWSKILKDEAKTPSECSGTDWWRIKDCSDLAESQVPETSISTSLKMYNFAGVSSNKLDIKNRRKTDIVFENINELQGNRKWGRILDAGTGPGSMTWLKSIESDGFTAITNDRPMKEATEVRKGALRDSDKIVLGTWMDETLMEGEVYDHVLAHYLIGSVEGYDPYKQDEFWNRLKRHLSKDGRMYVVGWEPFVPYKKWNRPAHKILMDAIYMRHACLYAHHQRAFREYPLDWYLRTLDASGFDVVSVQTFPVVFQKDWVLKECNVCKTLIPSIERKAPGIAAGLQSWMATIEAGATIDEELNRGVTFGMDFVLVAVPKQ